MTKSGTLTSRRQTLSHNSPPDPAGKAQTLAGDLPREFEHSRDLAIAHFFGTSDPAQIDDARCRFCYAPGHRHELHVAHDGRVLRLARLSGLGAWIGTCWWNKRADVIELARR